MTALRLLDRSSRVITWERLDEGDEVEVPNIGSALVLPGEHALGRLVPTGTGPMLEAAPLVVPREAAEEVAIDPTSWWRVLGEHREDVSTDGHHAGLVNDVRDVIWQLALATDAGSLPAEGELQASPRPGARPTMRRHPGAGAGRRI
jgi:hypothetical protein